MEPASLEAETFSGELAEPTRPSRMRRIADSLVKAFKVLEQGDRVSMGLDPAFTARIPFVKDKNQL